MIQKHIGFANGDSRNADGQALGVDLRAEAAGALDSFAFFYEQRYGVRPGASEGMRNLDRQNYYYDRFVNKRPGWTVAAFPGTSNHGWGLAVDFAYPLNVSTTEQHAWTAATAPLFGWEWTGVNFGEPWHFDYTGINVTAEQRSAYIERGLGRTTTEEGFLMALSQDQQNAMFNALLAGGGAYGWPEAIVGVIRKEVIPLINDVRAGRILFPGAPYYMAHAIVNTVRAEGGKELTPEDIGKLVQTNVKQAIREALTESGMNMRTAQAEEIIGTLTARLAPPEQADSVDAIAELEASVARVDAAAALPIEDAVIVEDKPAS